MARPPTALDHARNRIRRWMFVVGLGFGSYVLGVIISAQLVHRIGPRFASAGAVFQLAAMTVIAQFWLIAVFPLVCYGAARIIDLGPWSTALLGASTGEVFGLALRVISTGTDFSWQFIVMQCLAVAGGVSLCAYAVRRGRAAAAEEEAQAKTAAESRKSEYADFMKQAERASERAAASGPAEAAPAAAPSPAPAEPSAPADPPENKPG